jgi:hypothetical protein
MLERRAFLAAAAAVAFGGLSSLAKAQTPRRVPPFITRGLPGPGHDAMKVLVGKWRVSISLYMALGSPDHPVTSNDIITSRQWIDDGRFLHDTTTGTIGGMPYWRQGILGYDNMASSYQWVTVDNVNASMMFYQSAPGSGPHLPINMVGTFLDQGVLGEAYAGKTIGQRTEIIVKSPGEHVFNIYFTPPGEPERIVDHNVYTSEQP